MASSLTILDRKRDTQRERKNFAYSRRAESQFAKALRAVARQVGELVDGFDAEDPAFVPNAEAALGDYARMIRPWAQATAARMVAEVSRRDEAVWAEISQEMGYALQEEIRKAPTGELLRRLLAEQVDLITSLPLEAAQRVHKLTLKGLEQAGRAKEIAEAIEESGHVAKSRAMLIARTEVARTAASLTQARAEHVGSDGYVWRTVGDSDVRPIHRKLEGKFVRWTDPPVAGENGERAHAGMIYNCRCYPEPVLPDVIDFD